MAEMIYVKFFADDLVAMEELTYEEKGKLLEAMISYASTGERPVLDGNERFVFPWMKARIDRDREGIETRKEAGRKAVQARWNKAKDAEVCEELQNDTEEYDGIRSDTNDTADTINKEKRIKKKEERIKNKEDSESKRARTVRFSPPSEEDVEIFCKENGLNINAKRFVSFYESKGWRVGRDPMKDWRAAVRGWATRDSQEAIKPKEKPVLMSSYSADDIAAWEAMEVNAYDLRRTG